MKLKRAKRKAYTTDQALALISTAMKEASEILLYQDDPGLKIRAIQAMSQAANSWRGIVEIREFDERLKKLEAQQNEK